MLEGDDRRCIGCGDSEGEAHLERCLICGKWFCPDCSYRGAGRRFCSEECYKVYFWEGSDDDADANEISTDEDD